MAHVTSNLVLLPAQVTRRMLNFKEDQKVQSCHMSGREQEYLFVSCSHDEFQAYK